MGELEFTKTFGRATLGAVPYGVNQKAVYTYLKAFPGAQDCSSVVYLGIKHSRNLIDCAFDYARAWFVGRGAFKYQMFFILYVTIGLLAGFLAGLLGIGGGTVLVPGLLAIFAYANIPEHLQMHMATSTALTSIIFTSLIAVYHQQRSFSINWLLFRQLAPGMTVGIITGALLALLLSTQTLKLLFSLFLFSVAFRLYFHRSPTIKKEIIVLTSVKKWSIGSFIGMVSGVLGLGGGAVSVPVFLRLGLSTHHAIATSSACVLLLAILGAITFTITGLHANNLPSGSVGFVYWPAVVGISIGSVLFVPIGTGLGKRIAGNILRRLFALFLFVLGITLIIH